MQKDFFNSIGQDPLLPQRNIAVRSTSMNRPQSQRDEIAFENASLPTVRSGAGGGFIDGIDSEPRSVVPRPGVSFLRFANQHNSLPKSGTLKRSIGSLGVFSQVSHFFQNKCNSFRRRRIHVRLCRAIHALLGQAKEDQTTLRCITYEHSSQKSGERRRMRFSLTPKARSISTGSKCRSAYCTE